MEELPLQHFLFWRHHIEQNDTPANDTWKNDISMLAFQFNNKLQNDAQCNGILAE